MADLGQVWRCSKVLGDSYPLTGFIRGRHGDVCVLTSCLGDDDLPQGALVWMPPGMALEVLAEIQGGWPGAGREPTGCGPAFRLLLASAPPALCLH